MAAGGSTNPLRQQMINMMYLVLTALLALNVSADILKAFALVNKGLDKTNVSYEQKNDLTMSNFQKLYDANKGKAQVFYDRAQNAKKTANLYFNYLQSVKEYIAANAGGWREGTDKATVEDDKNLETSTHYFINLKHGDKLKDSLKEFVKTMKSYLGPGNENAVQFKIDTEDPPVDKEGTKKSWTEYYWEGVPAVAAVTELTKFQNDIRNAEAEVTNFNFKQVGAADYKFDNLVAIVSSETPTVAVNQHYKADIFLGAYSSTQNPEITVNGAPQKVEGGKASYDAIASGVGEKELDVKVRVPDPNTPGVFKDYTTKTKYQVFAGGGTISADKMNMLYIGLDNPISAAASGFTPQNTIVTHTGGGSWREVSPGHFIIKPDVNSPRELTITVSAKMSDGSTKVMQQQTYRVRKVPHPEVLFGTKNGGAISRGEIQAVSQINAGLGEGFAFEGLKYTVNSYTLAIAPKSGQAYIEPVSGNRITGTSRSHLGNVHTGDMIVIGNVDATGPAGKVVLGGVTLTVK